MPGKYGPHGTSGPVGKRETKAGSLLTGGEVGIEELIQDSFVEAPAAVSYLNPDFRVSVHVQNDVDVTDPVRRIGFADGIQGILQYVAEDLFQLKYVDVDFGYGLERFGCNTDLSSAASRRYFSATRRIRISGE